MIEGVKFQMGDKVRVFDDGKELEMVVVSVHVPNAFGYSIGLEVGYGCVEEGQDGEEMYAADDLEGVP